MLKDLEELLLESPKAVVGFFWLIMVDIHALSRNMEVVSNSRVKQPAVKDQSRLGHSAPGNHIRIGWEEALFGDAYDAATPFERCKYGALNVTLLYFAENRKSNLKKLSIIHDHP